LGGWSQRGAGAEETVRSYRDLKVWKKAIDLVISCYRKTRQFPKFETYGLASQVQRAAVSIPANLAEGHGRDSTKEYLRHISIAYGSLMELETHLLIAQRLKYIEAPDYEQLMESAATIGRMLNALKRSLARRLQSL
jgi:four helix bundle protein